LASSETPFLPFPTRTGQVAAEAILNGHDLQVNDKRFTNHLSHATAVELVLQVALRRIEFGRAATSALHFFLDIESETQWVAGSRRLDYAKRCFGLTR
jgi:hypothetical protein